MADMRIPQAPRPTPKSAPTPQPESAAPVAKADASWGGTPAKGAGAWGPAASASAQAVATPTVSTAPGDVVRRFYDAFEAKDMKGVQAAYAPNVKFKDELYSFSDRSATMHMWESVATNPTLKAKFTIDSVQGDRVSGHWVADYEVFNRPVHNEITTEMVVKNGQITEHTDQFNWNTWSRQALPGGPVWQLPGFNQLGHFLVRTFGD